MKGFKNKLAAITGAASRIGQALANRFAAEVMNLALTDIETEPLQAADRDIRSSGTEVLTVRPDVSNPHRVDTLVRVVVEQFGSAHILCNNAGIWATVRSIWERSVSDWQWTLSVNVMGVVNGGRAFVPILLMYANLLASLFVFAALAAAQTSTYIGGNANVSLKRIVTDASGNVYATGSELVAESGYAAHSVFVAKTDPSGALIYTARFGGKGDDLPAAIAVDTSGRVFVAGSTTSPDFPLRNPIQSQPVVGGVTGFVLCLDASGQLLWSTYFGGTAESPTGTSGNSVNAIAVDGAGNVYIAGTSKDPDLPTTPGAFQTQADFYKVTRIVSNGFVAKLSPNGQLLYCTWLSGNLINCNLDACFYNDPRMDYPTAIATDSSGAAYVTGYTDSSDFPTTPNAYRTTICCKALFSSYAAFLSKLSPDGSSLVYSTFLETLGSSSNQPAPGLNHGLFIDNSGDAWVAFGTTGPFTAGLGDNPPPPAGPTQIQIMEINPTGSSAIVSTILPDSADQYATGLTLDSAGNIYIAGQSALSDLLFELNPSGSSTLAKASFPLGATSQDIAVQPSGVLVAAGTSGRFAQFPKFSSGPAPAFLGAGNAATWSVDGGFTDNELISLYGVGIGPDVPVSAVPTPLTNSLNSAVYPQTLSGTSVLFNGNPAALLYVSSGQINAVLPAGLQSPINVQIQKNGATVGTYSLGVRSTAPTPGIFRNSNGTAAVLNHDGTLNTNNNPAHSGSIVSIWGTGIPDIEYLGGEIPSQVTNLASNVDLEVQAFGKPLNVTYAGPAPGLVGGVFQVNVVVAQSANLLLISGGVTSQPITVYVAP